MSDRITREEVRHVAALARLELPEAELDAHRAQLDRILEHVAELSTVDVSDVPPTFHPVPLGPATRPDEERPSLPREEALSQAPRSEAGGFAVPRLLD